MREVIKKHLSDSDFDLLCVQLKKYDETDLRQHQKKLAVLIGLQCGLRGQEHASINVENIDRDTFPEDHPLAGMLYYLFVKLGFQFCF